MDIDYDILLEYLSYKKQGKWSDFKRYVKDLIYDDFDVIKRDEINYFIGHVRRTLSALGHIEFIFSDKSEYIVAPPVISILPNSTKGVLCGYRTKEFLDKIKNKCRQLGFGYTEEDNYRAPKAIFIDFKSKENMNLCQQDSSLLNNDIKIVTDFTKKLLTVYPYIEEIIAKAPHVENLGECNVYNEVFHKFVSEAPKDNCACEKQYFGHNKYFVYRDVLNSYNEVEKHVAICNQYRHYCDKVIFELNENILKVNYINGLPELIDRALTLSSGKNRMRRKRAENRIAKIYSFIYDNISEETASLLSKKTGLKLEVKNG